MKQIILGKRLMARCRQLLQENEDIAKMVSSGRLAKLEGELAMHKKLVEEMKKNQVETDDFVQELDEDMVILTHDVDMTHILKHHF